MGGEKSRGEKPSHSPEPLATRVSGDLLDPPTPAELPDRCGHRPHSRQSQIANPQNHEQINWLWFCIEITNTDDLCPLPLPASEVSGHEHEAFETAVWLPEVGFACS